MIDDYFVTNHQFMADITRQPVATMEQTLNLDYACTEAEIKQAELLSRRLVDWNSLPVFLLKWGFVGVVMHRQIFQTVAPLYEFVALTAIFSIAIIQERWRRRSYREEVSFGNIGISKHGLKLVHPSSDLSLSWASFRSCKESPDLFVLMHPQRTAPLVVPKRVFPSAESQAWFRSLTDIHSPASEVQVPSGVEADSASGECVRLRVTLGFREYLDRAIATWKFWGLFLGVTLMIVGFDINFAINPPPDAVISLWTLIFRYELPMLMGALPFILLLCTIIPWLENVTRREPEELTLSNEGLFFAQRAVGGRLAWTFFTRYRETRWSFILWNHLSWIILPKRSFRSAADMLRTRVLLEKHLRKSWWFFG